MVATTHPLAKRILELIPINGLDPELQQEVLAKGEVLEIKRRKAVFEIGARDAFTFYLLDGELELESDGGAPVPMRAGDDNARRALAQLQPRRYTARARSRSHVFRIERAMLDYILSDEQVLERDSEMKVTDLETSEDEVDWMSRLLSSALFSRLPPDNIQKFFSELEPREVSAGDLVVEQGTEGDFLYIIAEGQCAVTRRAPRTGQDVTLATLRDGDSFGEEALISNTPRNASVSMLTDGFLMRLSKRSFEELVSKPTLHPVPWSEARELVNQGARWLDVRFVDEHANGAIADSLNVPLNVLRLELQNLDRSFVYVLYCDSGARSSTGAFLLARDGFDSYYLAGGLEHIPPGEAVPLVSRSQEIAAAALKARTDAEEPPAAPAQAPPVPAPAAETEAPKAKTKAKAKAKTKAKAHEPAAVPEVAKEPPPAAAVEEAQAELEELTRHMEALKAERDRVAGFAQQAADTAKELKRRYDELYRAAHQERTGRLAVEKDLATFKAEAERRAAMEEARLKGELDRAVARAEDAEKSRKTERETLNSERERLEQEAAAQRAECTRLADELKELEAVRLAQQVDFDNAQASMRATLDTERAKAGSAHEQLSQIRAELEQLQLKRDEQAQSQANIEQELRQRLESTRQALEQDRSALEAAREKLQVETEAAATQRAEMERSATELQREAQARAEELVQRTRALDDREVAVEDHRGQVELELARRTEALAAEDARLSEDKLAWHTRIDEAIESERKRLESANQIYRRELTEQARKDVAALLEQRETDIRADYETRLAAQNSAAAAELDAIAAQTEQRLRLERTRFEDRMTALTAVYDVRVAEQAAVLQDEQRRLATNAVRLREALNETERLKQELRQSGPEAVTAQAATPPSAAAVPGRPVPELTVADTPPAAAPAPDRPQPAAAQPSHVPPAQPSHVPPAQPSHVPAAQPRHVPPAQPSHVPPAQPSHVPPAQPSHVPAAQPSHVPAAQPSHVPPAQQRHVPPAQQRQAPAAHSVPVLDGNLEVRRTAGAANDERARVLSTEQIAAIRQKMQEKLKASRRGA